MANVFRMGRAYGALGSWGRGWGQQVVAQSDPRQHRPAVEEALARGANPNAVRCSAMIFGEHVDGPPLLHAIAWGFDVAGVETARALLDADARVDVVDSAGRGPLHHAIAGPDQKPNIGFIRELLARGADVNAADNRGGTPLMAAARANQAELIELLVSAGAAVDQPVLLSSAAPRLERLETVGGAMGATSPSLRPAQGGPSVGHTALTLATGNLAGNAVDALLRAGASPNLVVGRHAGLNCTALTFAIDLVPTSARGAAAAAATGDDTRAATILSALVRKATRATLGDSLRHALRVGAGAAVEILAPLCHADDVATLVASRGRRVFGGVLVEPICESVVYALTDFQMPDRALDRLFSRALVSPLGQTGACLLIAKKAIRGRRSKALPATAAAIERLDLARAIDDVRGGAPRGKAQTRGCKGARDGAKPRSAPIGPGGAGRPGAGADAGRGGERERADWRARGVAALATWETSSGRVARRL
ncbi:ankyrin repeat domain-containing protein [Burkholderia vietnamiensis]|nr:ankyrin repeat domain-containing protein [Burkholderia vietnamiensis]